MIPNTERLKKLANHLLSGKLEHQNFDFTVFNSGEEKTNGCGTNGCAIGECPFVFPNEWHFKFISTGSYPVLRSSKDTFPDTTHDAETFFSSHTDFVLLFVPRAFAFEGCLASNATKEDVGNNILKFCAQYE